jgi:hypothetical protein
MSEVAPEIDPLDLLEAEAQAAEDDPDLLDQMAEIERLTRYEAALWRRHGEFYAEATRVCKQIDRLPPAPRPVHPRTDPHRALREEAGKWMERGNACYVKALRLKEKRRTLESLVAQR